MELSRCYENLATSIIGRAVGEYKCAYRAFLKGKNVKSAVECMEEIEEFFLSDWFKTISNIDGKRFLNKLQEKLGIKEENKIA